MGVEVQKVVSVSKPPPKPPAQKVVWGYSAVNEALKFDVPLIEKMQIYISNLQSSKYWW